MSTDPALRFFNQANRTSHENWDFDVTGYLQRSATDLYNAIAQSARELDEQDD
jgi:hypothetical protein